MKLKAVLLTVSFVGLPLAAVAAQHETRPGQPAEQQPGQQQQVQQQQVQERAEARGLLASDALRGANVRDQARENVGSIHRVVVDQKSGEIKHVILATGGFLGIGRDHVQVSWNDLRLMRDNGNLVAQIDRQRVEQAPEVDGRMYERRGAPMTTPGAAPAAAPRDRVGAPPATVPRDQAATPPPTAADQRAVDQRATDQRAADQRAADRPAVAPRLEQAQADPNLVTLNQLEGANIHDQQRRDIGSVERLMINPAEGRVRYAVVGTGGFLGIGRDQILVPWDNMKFAWDGNRLVVNLDQKILDEAPRTWVGRDEPAPAAAPRDPAPRQQQTPPPATR